MESRKQFTFYESFFQAMVRIRKDADRAKAYDAIAKYALYGEEPDMDALPDAASLAFVLIKPNLDSSRKRSESGRKGGKKSPKEEANNKQNTSKDEARESGNGVRDRVRVRERLFIPPSAEEVEAYVKEKGYHIDPESFVAFYTSKGWKVGSSPMKDWKAAVVTWEKKYKENHPSQPEEKEERPVLDIEEFNARWEQMGG